MLDHFGHSRAMLDHFGPFGDWGHIWDTLGHLGSFLVIFWAISWHIWTKLRKVQFFCGPNGVVGLALRMYALRKRHLWLCCQESPMKIFQNIPTCLQILDKTMEGDGEDINSLNNGSNHQHHTILVQVYRWNRIKIKNQFRRLCSL